MRDILARTGPLIGIMEMIVIQAERPSPGLLNNLARNPAELAVNVRLEIVASERQLVVEHFKSELQSLGGH